MLKKLLIAAFIGFSAIIIPEKTLAQDPEFTQFYANPLYLNPAFAGTARCPRIIMNYRNQWPRIPGTFVTYNASYDQHVDDLSGGIGLLVNRDAAGHGTLITTSYNGIYAYQLTLSRNLSLKFGAQASFRQKTLDWTKLTFGDQIDSRNGFIYPTGESQPVTTRSYVDFSAGFLAFSKRYFGGFAAHHLTQPDESFIGPAGVLPMKYTAHVGAVLPIGGGNGDDASISPNVLFQKQQDFDQMNLGLYVNKGPLVGGVWFRNGVAYSGGRRGDSFILLLGFQQKTFKFGYSYDVTVSKLTMATAGSHEVSFALQFDCKPKKKKFRTISCPSF